MLQIENEYGLIEKDAGEDGHKYILWAGEFANSLETGGVPWIMCVQNNVPSVINTANGFYADQWIEGHRSRFPTQPAMFTELWSGWFQKWGDLYALFYLRSLTFSIN